jgi:threonine dehydratase
MPSVDSSEVCALIQSVAVRTPLETADLHPRREVLLKREDLGPNRSFKWRGAIAAVEELRQRGATTVVTASTGNHGVAVAWAAARLGMVAHIVVPVDAVRQKCEMIAVQGAELHLQGPSLEDAVAAARALATELGAPLFEDGASEAQLLGTSTIGHELRAESSLDAVLVPLACGALAGGLAAGLKSGADPPTVIGVQSIHFSRIAAALRGIPYVPTGKPTLADGLADDRIVEPAFTYCRRYVDDVVTVEDRQLEAAIGELWRACGLVVEGAAAAPLAALRAYDDRIPGAKVALVISGGNLDPGVRDRILGDQKTAGHLVD